MVCWVSSVAIAAYHVIVFVTVASAGRYVSQNTTGDLKKYSLNDLGVQITRYGHLVFDVQACQDAFVYLDETTSHNNYYQLVLGGTGNSWVGVRNRDEYGGTSVSVYGSFLNCTEFITFWLTWDDKGKVVFGKGGNPGEDVILTFTDSLQAFEIHYISVSSYYDQTGMWQFLIDDSPVFTTPSPDGNTTLYVSETSLIGSTILTVAATDPEDDNVTFDVVGEHADVFICAGNELKLNASLDFEKVQQYTVYIRANDSRNTVGVTMDIKVIDEIDEVPRILTSDVTSILEELPPGTVIGPFYHVTDGDIHDTLSYSLSGPDESYFSINSSTGEMSMKTRLNRDGGTGKTEISVNVTVTDSAGLTSSISVALNVTDVNDNTPTFSQTVYNVNITENSAADFLLGQLTCTDDDWGDNSNITLTIISGNDVTNPVFRLRGQELLANGSMVDYESPSAHEYILTVLATDNPSDSWQNTATAVVVIQILPRNEYTPVWVSPVTNSSNDFPSHVILENTTIGSLILSFLADDQDGGLDGVVEYQLTSVLRADGVDASGTFAVDSKTGELTTLRSLDRDRASGGTKYYDIVVTATDSNSKPKSIYGKMRLLIDNVNDNAPRFNQSVYHFQVSCDLDLGNQTLQLSAADDDDDDDGDAFLSFLIESNVYVSINSSTGTLTPVSRSNSTVPQFVLLKVNVVDGGTPQLSADSFVLLELLPCTASTTSISDIITSTVSVSDSTATSSTSETTTATTTTTTTTTTTPTTTTKDSGDQSDQESATSVESSTLQTFLNDLERWSLRILCGVLTTCLIVIALVYAFKSKCCTVDSSVRKTRVRKVSPIPTTSTTLSSSSSISTPSWSTGRSLPTRTTGLTSYPSVESLHLV